MGRRSEILCAILCASTTLTVKWPLTVDDVSFAFFPTLLRMGTGMRLAALCTLAVAAVTEAPLDAILCVNCLATVAQWYYDVTRSAANISLALYLVVKQHHVMDAPFLFV